MKKIKTYIFIVVVILGIFTQAVSSKASTANPNEPCTYTIPSAVPNNSPCKDPAFTPGTNQPVGTDTTKDYHLLAPLKGVEGFIEDFNAADDHALSKYLNLMIGAFIGLCGVLAVMMILAGGIQYATSELISSKEAAREKIQGAILGLLLALGAFVILNQLNPDLLKIDLNIKKETVTVELKEFIVLQSDGSLASSIPGKPVPVALANGTCNPQNIINAAKKAGHDLTVSQANTLSCFAAHAESGCQSITNYNWGKGSSAFGVFQILLQAHSNLFEIPVCHAAAGVKPINCSKGFSGGNPVDNQFYRQCIKAASDFTCNTAVAASLVKKRPDFGDWANTKDSTSKHKACVEKFKS